VAASWRPPFSKGRRGPSPRCEQAFFGVPAEVIFRARDVGSPGAPLFPQDKFSHEHQWPFATLSRAQRTSRRRKPQSLPQRGTPLSARVLQAFWDAQVLYPGGQGEALFSTDRPSSGRAAGPPFSPGESQATSFLFDLGHGRALPRFTVMIPPFLDVFPALKRERRAAFFNT